MEIQLSAGTLEYEDTRGDGPVLVFIHGLAMDGSLWRRVVAELRQHARCIVPTLPLGSHRSPMRPDADLSLPGQARIVAEFLERLDLRNVVLVSNDIAIAQVVAVRWPERVGGLVLTSQEAFHNWPPGIPGKLIALADKLPGGLWVAMQSLRWRPFRRLPMTWGWMTKSMPHEAMDAWFRPLQTQRAIRHDLHKYIAAVKRGYLVEIAEELRNFDKPALVVWAADDRVMPPAHGRRLAELLPRGQLVTIEGSYTLLPEDQPKALAEAIRIFLHQACSQMAEAVH